MQKYKFGCTDVRFGESLATAFLIYGSAIKRRVSPTNQLLAIF